MRVISGIRRGHKLKAPEGMQTRPTTDRVKESIFNLIQMYLPAGQVLDLFAGSGAMGIEAISRGTQHAVFIEKDKKAFALLNDNLRATRFTEFSEARNEDALRYLAGTTRKFDMIFLDPPYNQGLLLPVADLIAGRGILNAGGIVVVESEAGGECLVHDGFLLLKQAKYGKTVVSVLYSSDRTEVKI